MKWIPPPPTTLTPFSSKTVKDRENLLTYLWKLSLRGIKCKNLIKIGWKIKISHLLQNRIFKTLWPLLYKKWYILQKNAWRNFYCIFYKESFAKNPIKIWWEIKKFQKLGRGHYWTPHISITVRDRSRQL